MIHGNTGRDDYSISLLINLSSSHFGKCVMTSPGIGLFLELTTNIFTDLNKQTIVITGESNALRLKIINNINDNPIQYLVQSYLGGEKVINDEDITGDPGKQRIYTFYISILLPKVIDRTEWFVKVIPYNNGLYIEDKSQTTIIILDISGINAVPSNIILDMTGLKTSQGKDPIIHISSTLDWNIERIN